MQSQLIGEKQGDLFKQNVWIKNALHTRHVAFKSKIQWYLAKQMTKVYNMNSNQFHHLSWEKQGYRDIIDFKLRAIISNFKSQTCHERLCTLFDFSG